MFVQMPAYICPLLLTSGTTPADRVLGANMLGIPRFRVDVPEGTDTLEHGHSRLETFV